jgi:hypothetical protein
MKKEPPGVPFKLFSDSLNIKILSSDIVLFMLVKVLDRASVEQKFISFSVSSD